MKNITWVSKEYSILFSGELTRHTVPKIPQQLSQSLFNNEVASTSGVILDLKAVTAIDTAGLA